MATAKGYIVGIITYAVWMLGFLVLNMSSDEMMPIARDLGGDFMAEPIGWYQQVLHNWPLLGLVGIFVALLATGIASNARTY